MSVRESLERRRLREGGRMEQSESDMRRSVGRGRQLSRLSTASIGHSTAGET